MIAATDSLAVIEAEEEEAVELASWRREEAWIKEEPTDCCWYSKESYPPVVRLPSSYVDTLNEVVGTSYEEG